MGEHKEIALEDGTKAGDIVLVSGVYETVPIPCLVLSCLDQIPDGRTGNVLIRPITTTQADIEPRWVFGISVYRLTPSVGLNLIKEFNSAAAAIADALLKPSS